MKRELASKMYSPSPYFLGRYFSTVILQLFYPMIMILILFWLLDINTSSVNFWWFVAYGVLSNFIFCGQGFFVGIMVMDADQAKIVNFLFVMVFLASNGVLCNLTTANWFITGLAHFSPCRFNTEGFVRRVTM